MFEVELSTVNEQFAIFSNLTDKELLASINHYHAELPPLLKAMVNRFEVLSAMSDTSRTVVASCPSCGTNLQVKVTPVS